MEKTVTVRFRVYGIVQGVGFRPTVDRHAAASGIRGSVCNKGPYVEIIAQGSSRQIRCFENLLREQPPRRSSILKIDCLELAGTAFYDRFSIVESEKTEGEIYISPDIAVCEDCMRELYDPQDRRYLHPFINCTCCGPRMTILDALPYDRERTSMKMFPMCRTCAEEYHSPLSRRYDAQPVCCNDCGPSVYLLDRSGAKADTGKDSGPVIRGRDAITAARKKILEGGIVAVKGIGGFHLCCDACSEEAVSKLRVRKHRPAKPFAVMMRDEDTVRRECRFNEEQRQILTGHQKPILLLDRRQIPPADREAITNTRVRSPEDDHSAVGPVYAEAGAAGIRAYDHFGNNDEYEGKSLLAPSVAPGNPKVGVMLPYTPLHMLLFTYDDGLSMPDCLVMTSGNVSGAPICRDDDDVLTELSAFCDCILSHDRKIRIRADDTVMDFHRGHPYMIRRSRGYAPLPVLFSGFENWKGCVLAVGGELKNTFCITSGGLLYMSPYIGDLEDLRTVRALEETIGRMEKLLEVTPAAVVSDMHPGYNSVSVAEEIASGRGLPLIKVQHHYAHTLSCMAENDCCEPVIGISFDGTGYGSDGSIWGGEILLADLHGFQRAASITPFIQPGGDSAPRQGWRIAVSMIYDLCSRGLPAKGSLKCSQKHYPEKKQSEKTYSEKNYFRKTEPGKTESGKICSGTGYSGKSRPEKNIADNSGNKDCQYISAPEPGAISGNDNNKIEKIKNKTDNINKKTETSAAGCKDQGLTGTEYYSILEELGLCDLQNAKILHIMLEKNIRTVASTSAGRLFDAVSAMLGICRESTYEGEASIELEFAAERFERKYRTGTVSPEEITEGSASASESSAFVTEKSGFISEKFDFVTEGIDLSDEMTTISSGSSGKRIRFRQMPTDRLFSDLLRRRLAGEDVERLAWLFHRGLSDFIVQTCKDISADTGIRTAALSGGCFQNRLLLSMVQDGLEKEGIRPLIHHLIPPNDGGIALGQALAGMCSLKKKDLFRKKIYTEKIFIQELPEIG